jgi:hypothetical protein
VLLADALGKVNDMADFRSASEITNKASGLLVVTNAPDDYSLKIISADGTKNVTIVRYAGPSASMDIQIVYELFVHLFDVLGLEA